MKKQLLTALVLVASCLIVPLQADWNPQDGHKMHFPQLPDEEGWNVNGSQGSFLADDWMCSESGPVSDIHFWGSWLNGTAGVIESFTIAIYADVPDPDPQDPATHSMPGQALWIRNFLVSDDVVIRHIVPDPQLWEGWYDPYSGEYLYSDHDNYFQYNIIGIDDPFVQEQGTIYWLGITANILPQDPQPLWGWKSSIEHWNDDAVYGIATCVVPDDGTGTLVLPVGCPFVTGPEDPMYIIDGLPPGTTLEMDARLVNFTCDQTGVCSSALPPGQCEGVGGSLGGNFHCFEATLQLSVNGTGDLSGYNRTLLVPVSAEIHTAPRTPGDPLQVMTADLYYLEGELFGDPDFCSFHILGGTSVGLPSPGEVEFDNCDPDWWVESFFDVTYQIEFEGCPGSPLDGYMGLTTATTRLTQGGTTWTEMYEPAVGDADTVWNAFSVVMDPTGTVIEGDGENAFGDGWYFYPQYDWWNIWFYDHPYDDNRHKEATIDLDVFPLEPGPSYIELAINWSTDIWSIEQPPGDSTPPLPGVNEDLYIGREVLLVFQDPNGHFTLPWIWPDYNPEWVSIDIRGYNFVIPAGVIMHACVGETVTQSMDLSFVINNTDNCCLIRGDINHSGSGPDIADLVYLVTYMFQGGPEPPCMAEANINGSIGSDVPDISDLVWLVSYMFQGGPAPVPCP